MNMGRIGDGDVHAAYVEFRAKESDKVCIETSILLHSFLSFFVKLYFTIITPCMLYIMSSIPETTYSYHNTLPN